MFTRRLFTILLLAGALASPVAAREITHAMGVTDVPDNPQRVVILTNEGTEALLYLGVVPVGAAQSWSGDPWYDHIAAPLADTVALGTELAVNLEILATLEPDLILGTKVRQEAIYPQLSAIAPTVMPKPLAVNGRTISSSTPMSSARAPKARLLLPALPSALQRFTTRWAMRSTRKSR
jgi:iron complex transport system substrate-binding protein